MPNKELECLTTKRLYEELTEPLSLLVVDVTRTAQRFEDAIQSGQIERPYLEVNLKRARTAIALLQSVYRKEIHGKLEDAFAGTYRWRKQLAPKADRK